jgi:uncharacterized damage-inducible protein DinB
MKDSRTLAVMGMVALVALAKICFAGGAGQVAGARGQEKAAAPAANAQPDMSPVANPVSTAVKGQLPRFEKNMVAAAEAMPADKYSYKPTADMNTYGHLMMHIAQSNNLFCSKIAGTAAPDAKITETDAKDKLVAAVKDSFAYCTTALANVDDAKLSEQMVVFGTRTASRGGVFVMLAGSWTDHYGTQAIYLRLNGILPPTAQPKKD